MQHLSIRSALATAFQIPLRPAPRPQLQKSLPSFQSRAQPPRQSNFSTTPFLQAGKRKGGAKPERRITAIRHFLYHPTQHTPRPLRFSRNRSLRHWTITRAWRLHSANLRSSRALELEAQYNAMNAACEELRTGVGDGGRLFRKAMMKTGTWGIRDAVLMMGRGGKGKLGEGGKEVGGVPIEYARGLSEWVGSVGSLGKKEGREVWDEGWKRW